MTPRVVSMLSVTAMAGTLVLVAIGAWKRVAALEAALEGANRIAGMLVGALALATVVGALAARPRSWGAVAGALTAVVCIGAAGALGMRALPHDVAPWRIPTQLALTWLTLVALGAVREGVRERGAAPSARAPVSFVAASAVVLVLTLAQGALGGTLRGAIDVAVRAQPVLPRDQWLEQVAWPELAHLVLGPLAWCAVVALALFVPRDHARALARPVWAALALASLQVIAGATLTRLGLPPLAQLAHVLLALGTASALSLTLARALAAARRPDRAAA